MARPQLLAAAVAAAVCAVAIPAAQQPTFRAGIDLVHFGVTVTDRQGNLITDLTADDFEIFEDRERQTIEYFARGEGSDDALDLHVGLLFDTSGSMREDIGLARTAAIRFLSTLTDAKDFTLVEFDSQVRVARFGQADFPRLVERIRSREPEGWTALYDALGVYLDGAAENEGRTVLVIFTDGGDTRSAMAFRDLMTLVRASGATIFSIGFLDHQRSTGRVEQRARLHQIAEAAGGQAFFPSNMNDVEAAYDRIVAQIRAQYTLGYTSTNTDHDGSWRRVEVRVMHPDLRGTRVLTRGGYFALYRDP